MKPLLIYCVIALLVSACVSNPLISTPTPGKIVVPNNAPRTQPLSEHELDREQETSSSIQATQDIPSSTSTQIALVIGNSQYDYRPLRNPTNDAEAIAKVLGEKGFEVILKTNLKYGDMKAAIRQFGQRLAASKGIGLFFFAGHGVQVKGENYLIPINNNHIIDEIDVQNSAIRLSEIVQRMEEAKNRLNIMVLDACRDNPFKDGSLNRNLSRGLARAHVQADGMLIAFATSPNKTASDGLDSGQNGLYTHHLLQVIQTPNLKIEDVFKQVRQAVKDTSNGEQVPWYNASLSGDFCFGGCKAPSPVVPAPQELLVSRTSTTPSQVLRTLQTQSRVNSIALSPEGRLLASGNGDATIKVWDVTSGQKIRTLRGHKSFIYSVAFSPDGQLLASGSGDGTAKLWRVSTGELIQSLKGQDYGVASVAFSPDGRLLALAGKSSTFLSSEGTIQLWEIATGNQLIVLKGHKSNVSSVAFSPDGRLLASGSDDKIIKLWDVATRQLFRSWFAHKYGVSSVAFSPDSRTLASGGDDEAIKLWDIATGKEIRTLRGKSPVWSVIFSPSGKLLASAGGERFGKSSDDTITLWNVATGKDVYHFQGYKSVISSLAFSGDEKILVSGSSSDETIILWQVPEIKE